MVARTAKVAIWRNPHCSKSRAALARLRERGIEPIVIDYPRHPPDAPPIERALELLAVDVRRPLRIGEPAYAELGLGTPGRTRQQLVAVMASRAILVQRPIVFANGRTALGRPPEAVLRIL